MIAELGHYALMLALGLALIQGIMPIVGTSSNDPTLISVAVPAATCYVTSDFSVYNVYENSNSAMPLLYRFTSVWGNHEGSMMLWVSILALFGALVAAFGGNLPAKLRRTPSACGRGAGAGKPACAPSGRSTAKVEPRPGVESSRTGACISFASR